MELQEPDKTPRVRVYEVYEKVGDDILKYATLNPDEYVPHSFITPKKNPDYKPKPIITTNTYQEEDE